MYATKRVVKVPGLWNEGQLRFGSENIALHQLSMRKAWTACFLIGKILKSHLIVENGSF